MKNKNAGLREQKLETALEIICAIYADNSHKLAPITGGEPAFTMERAISLAHEALNLEVEAVHRG